MIGPGMLHKQIFVNNMHMQHMRYARQKPWHTRGQEACIADVQLKQYDQTYNNLCTAYESACTVCKYHTQLV